MTTNPQQLFALGQSLWYDNIERRLLKNGELNQMIQRGDIYGVTSNPSIFNNAIAKSLLLSYFFGIDYAHLLYHQILNNVC